jgi:hypothetical protein
VKFAVRQKGRSMFELDQFIADCRQAPAADRSHRTGTFVPTTLPVMSVLRTPAFGYRRPDLRVGAGGRYPLVLPRACKVHTVEIRFPGDGRPIVAAERSRAA